ncbi:MAG: S41 family peptidase [Xylanivirga thermophila]|jgi:carboxyl-terminal processing protease|uniref:S41 family peptidase n=1 Tax=Xylanivirga thermophila TaxID=2496273 RepID=UPI0039F5A807
MISKKKAAIGAAILIVVTAIVSSFFAIQIDRYASFKNGTAVVPRKNFARMQDYGKLDAVRSILEGEYIEEPDNDKMLDGAIKGLVASLEDPYSYYFTQEEFRQFTERTQGSYAGVGMVVTVEQKDNTITVVRTFKGSPAAKAGIVAEDKIVKVSGEEVDGSMLDNAVAMMRGEPGSKVKVTINRNGELKEFELERAIVEIPDLEYRMLEDDIGYIWLYSFDENSAKNFENALNDMKKQGMKAFILDLRGNPGGLLSTCVDIADILLPEGLVVYRMDRSGNREDYKSDAKQLKLPMAVLVDENSASASEVLTGAIQDYGVATIIGKTTFGKGVVQDVRPFKDGSALKYTTSKYYTPKGRDINKKGLKPDIEVDMTDEAKNYLIKNSNNDLPLELDAPLLRAIEEVKHKKNSK